jgi:pyruvate dehydrogenase E2 component (dihydrolipoamide acetyltransferase)
MSTEFEFKLPDLGEGMTEGEIVEWHVAVGDTVTEDAPMVEVMSDKATVTIGAPRSGWVRELRFAPGETAKVGDVLHRDRAPGRRLRRHAATTATPRHRRSRVRGPAAATAVGDLRDVLPGAGYFQRNSAAAKPAANDVPPRQGVTSTSKRSRRPPPPSARSPKSWAWICGRCGQPVHRAACRTATCARRPRAATQRADGGASGQAQAPAPSTADARRDSAALRGHAAAHRRSPAGLRPQRGPLHLRGGAGRGPALGPT